MHCTLPKWISHPYLERFEHKMTSNIHKLQVQSWNVKWIVNCKPLVESMQHSAQRQFYDFKSGICWTSASFHPFSWDLQYYMQRAFFILITLSFPLGFRSFSLPIFISYNVFTADWQKSLLLSLLLWASLGYWRGVDFCRRRIMAEYGWRDGAAIGQFVSILDTPAQVFSPLLLLLLQYCNPSL